MHLFQQLMRFQYHAVTANALNIVMQDARWNHMQYRFFAVNYQSMTGVVAALKTHYGCDFIGQPIDNLALSFIAPLSTNDDYAPSHIPALFVNDYLLFTPALWRWLQTDYLPPSIKMAQLASTTVRRSFPLRLATHNPRPRSAQGFNFRPL